MSDRRRVHVAAAQVSGGIFDSDRTADRLLTYMADAASQNIELLVLPECYIGGYPYWHDHVSVKQETALGAQLCESAIRADGLEVAATAREAVAQGIAVVGANEEECLVPATLDFWDRALTKSYLDTVGHYARWDIFDFGVAGHSLIAGWTPSAQGRSPERTAPADSNDHADQESLGTTHENPPAARPAQEEGRAP